jgi:hypothetical protein
MSAFSPGSFKEKIDPSCFKSLQQIFRVFPVRLTCTQTVSKYHLFQAGRVCQLVLGKLQYPLVTFAKLTFQPVAQPPFAFAKFYLAKITLLAKPVAQEQSNLPNSPPALLEWMVIDYKSRTIYLVYPPTISQDKALRQQLGSSEQQNS